MPNVAAGSIIGKAGTNITEIQTQSNARMQVRRRAGGGRQAGGGKAAADDGLIDCSRDSSAGCTALGLLTCVGWCGSEQRWGRRRRRAGWGGAANPSTARPPAPAPSDPSTTSRPAPPALPRLQLSRASEFYPGSPEGQDRILLVSGTVNQLLTALHLVLSKLKAEPGALRAVQAKEGEAIQLCMLVHSRLCGTLIGKGGATIRSFNEDSRAVFNISPHPTLPGGCDGGWAGGLRLSWAG